MDPKFKKQEDQYSFPYHYLVSFGELGVGKVMNTGVEYFCYMSKVLSLVHDTSYRTLLDVGCGDGRMVSLLAPEHSDRTYVGVDLSKLSILLATALNYGVKNAQFFCRDAAEMDEEFDLVTCVETLEHVPDAHIARFAETLYARLRPGGQLIVSVPSTVIPLQSKHYRHYTRALLEQQLHQFEPVSCHYVMRTGFWRDVCVRIARKFPSHQRVQRLVTWIGNRMIFTADEQTGRHIVAVFRKNTASAG